MIWQSHFGGWAGAAPNLALHFVPVLVAFPKSLQGHIFRYDGFQKGKPGFSAGGWVFVGKINHLNPVVSI